MVTIVRRIVVLLYLYAISLASGSHLHHVVVGKADVDKLVALEAHLQLSQILACAVVQFKASARAATIIIIIFLIIILSFIICFLLLSAAKLQKSSESGLVQFGSISFLSAKKT